MGTEKQMRWIFTHTSRPEIDPILDLAVLEPTSTFLLEHCRLVELIKVSVDIIDGLLLHADRLDVLMLNLLHHLNRVLDGRLDGRKQGSG